MHHETPSSLRYIKAEGIVRRTAVYYSSDLTLSESIPSTMKSALTVALTAILVPLSTLVVALPNGIVHRRDDNTPATCGDWVQRPKGHASFTSAEDCTQGPCKLCAYFSPLLGKAHTERVVLAQRAAKISRTGSQRRSTCLHLVTTTVWVTLAGAASK